MNHPFRLTLRLSGFYASPVMQIAAIFVLAGLLAVPSAQGTGILAGRVHSLGDTTLIPKTVWVGALPAAVAADGTFRADSVPAGPCDLAIETSKGLFVVATPVTIAPGATRRVQLAFGGRQDNSAPQPAEKEKKKKRGGIWANPATATLIIIGSAIVVGFAVDELTQSQVPVSPTSQSAPTN